MGIIPKDSDVFLPLMTPPRSQTDTLSPPNWCGQLLDTRDFLTTTRNAAERCVITDYLRPVNWIISLELKNGSMVLIAMSLLQDIRESKYVHLHMYAPRTTQAMKPFDDDFTVSCRYTHVDTPLRHPSPSIYDVSSKSGLASFISTRPVLDPGRLLERDSISVQSDRFVLKMRRIAISRPTWVSHQLLDDVTSAKDVLAAHLLKCADDIMKEPRMRMKVLVDGDDLLANLPREWTDATNQLKETRSEVEQAINQLLEAESELSELRGKMRDIPEMKEEGTRINGNSSAFIFY